MTPAPPPSAAAVQTVWARLVAGTLADAGVATVVISPGSRSTPLTAAFHAEPGLELATIIDERAAAFYALGAARATGRPAAMVCTSGTAAAHYLPALVEASLAGVPLLAITADRPPELHACGASQTIDQVGIYGGFVRGAFDLGAPVASDLALRALRRKVIQAVTLARGPHAGPVHLEVPLRKPLEPAAPATDDERALARFAVELRSAMPTPLAAAPRALPDPAAIAQLAADLAREPHGAIVAGAMPASFAGARELVLALAARTGYPILAEAGSQLRFGPRPADVTFVDRFDLIPTAALPEPRVILQLGAEPVAAAWPAWLARIGHARRVLAGPVWHDPDSSAHAVVLGDVELALRAVDAQLRECSDPAARTAWAARWRDLDDTAAAAVERALAEHPRSETAAIRAALHALPVGAALQIGNSLPIRVVDHASGGASPARAVLTQRGAAGIDGLIASAAGATVAGTPTLVVLGDVSFAHDLGGLLAARAARAPLAILVVDNGGGQIFSGLPVAGAQLGEAAFAQHWLTPPAVDARAVAAALGARVIHAPSPAAVAAGVAAALAGPAGATVIHAEVSTSGARDVRRAAITGGDRHDEGHHLDAPHRLRGHPLRDLR
ncbi:MAG: 2-succinyl-5-enolpyruvyl-6-hydroxy-3-cyclohexene-1-carboxylic-acid synthase [Deltaproteobacteria bacterium]|nr:2-succinyl-5-enolpyruvyl-6-hydroxy-3-cyclohexene-1-carboxylic-acid synthase [Deltaproteobacteria bacterium]